MLSSKVLRGKELAHFRDILLNENLPFGVERKFSRFLDGAVCLRFNRESMYAVAEKKGIDDYELDFVSRENTQLLMFFAAALQQLEDERK